MPTDPNTTTSTPDAEPGREAALLQRLRPGPADGGAWRTVALWVSLLLALALWLHGDEGRNNVMALQWLNKDLPTRLPAAMQNWAWPRVVSWLTVLGDTHVMLLMWLWWLLHRVGRASPLQDPLCSRQGWVGWARHPVDTVIAAAMALTMLLGSACSLILKEWFDAARPASMVFAFDAWQPMLNIIGSRVVEHSFPSGHSIAAFAGVGLLLPTLGSSVGRHIGLLLASLVALSRVATGAHWPVDVVAGALLGLGCGYLSWWCARQLLRRPRRWAVLGRGLAVTAQAVLLANALVAPFRDLGYALADGVAPVALAACCLEAARARLRLRAAAPK